MLVVGDGPQRAFLEQLTETLKLTSYVLFLGNRNDVHEILQAFDIFLFPSKNEGLGIAAIEAQSADLITVISPAIPKEAIITQKVKQVPSFDPNEWAKVMSHMSIGKRSDVSEEIIKAGYDIEAISKWLCEFYFKKS